VSFYNRIINKTNDIIQKVFLRNPIACSRIRQVQRRFLDSQECNYYDSLIVFFVPGYDRVSGGIMSIISIASETQTLFSKSKTGVFVCPVPCDPPLSRFTKFENNHTLVGYEELLLRCCNAKKMLVHIPEYYVHCMADKYHKLLNKFDGDLYINIMLQNINLDPNPYYVDRLKLLGPVTITTAHKAYSGEKTGQRYGCPVHHLSAWVNSGKYIYKTYDEKRALIVVSPDEHPLRDAILNEIRKQLPEFDFVTIQNMTYRSFLEIISEARFSLTFGEGLDGYFSEPILSGGIGCSVYNDRFFEPEYKYLPFVYASWDDLVDHIAEDIIHINMDSHEYSRVHKAQYHLLSSKYSFEDYRSNISSYYAKFFKYAINDQYC